MIDASHPHLAYTLAEWTVKPDADEPAVDLAA